MNRIVRALQVLFGIKRKYTKRVVREVPPRKRYLMSPSKRRHMQELLTMRWERMRKLGITGNKVLSVRALTAIERRLAEQNGATIERIQNS